VSACATPVTYVVDAASELKPLLRSLHAPSAGRVHCYAASSRAVARVLEAMGNSGAHPLKPDFATAWLLGRGIRDIFLDHADRMDSNQPRDTAVASRPRARARQSASPPTATVGDPADHGR
jgi:hypothetical protein